MSHLLSNNYLVNRPIELAMKKFATRFSASHQVLDIGCGQMPYRHFFICRYVGADPLSSIHPDLICPAWHIPCPDNAFDGIILNQSLEHIRRPFATIKEVYRLLKPGGFLIITAPQTMKNHSVAVSSVKAPWHNFDTRIHPYWQNDFFRFTKYGLISLCHRFSIIDLYETTGYFGSILQLFNYFFASTTRQHSYLSPIYFLNNLAGLTLDYLARSYIVLNLPFAKKFNYFIFSSLTINLILVAQKPR